MRVLLNPSRQKHSSADSLPKGKALAQQRAPSPVSFTPVAQAKTIDVGPHGEIWVPEGQNLNPDEPVFGGTSNVGSGALAHPAATSMQALVTPAHPQGSEPKALKNLFDGLPTKGNYKLQSNVGKQKDGSTLYIKGHLLNDNLGGPGTEENLFPITHQANVDHDQKVEEKIKDHVNKEGGAIHYEVSVTPVAEGDSGVFDSEDADNCVKYVDANFVCKITEYTNDEKEVVRPTITIQSRWGATDNKKVKHLELLGKNAHGVADKFDVTKVLLMPRAIAKKEWDNAYTLLVQGLADVDGVNFTKWLTGKVKGLGKEGIKALEEDNDYESLNSKKKATLTKARNLLKEFLDANFKHYLTVAGGYDEDDAVIPTPEEIQDINEITVEAKQTEVMYVEVDKEIDMLSLEFSKMSIEEEPVKKKPVLDNSWLYKQVVIIRNPDEQRSFHYKGYYAEVREHAGLGRYVLLLQATGERVVLTPGSFRLRD